MLDVSWGVPLAGALVGSVVGCYSLIYAWLFAKRLLR